MLDSPSSALADALAGRRPALDFAGRPTDPRRTCRFPFVSILLGPDGSVRVEGSESRVEAYAVAGWSLSEATRDYVDRVGDFAATDRARRSEAVAKAGRGDDTRFDGFAVAVRAAGFRFDSEQ